jgi:ubiquinone/menaquinone biosynthesis C-methylase UbiE
MLRRSADARSERLRRYWDKQALKYDKQVAFFERRLLGDGRHWVCSRATGDVLEVAIGTGRNLPFYPEGIRLTGTDFSPAMLELARRQADQLGRRVDLLLGDAQALELPDASFDTVVCTLSLCAIPDDRRAVAEMKRVLRPGGQLLLLDHVAGLPRGMFPSARFALVRAASGAGGHERTQRVRKNRRSAPKTGLSPRNRPPIRSLARRTVSACSHVVA